MQYVRFFSCSLLLPVLVACGAEGDPVTDACGSLPQEEESVSLERATSFGLFDGPLRCVARNSIGSTVVQFYEDGTFESEWQETDEPDPDLEGWAISRDEGRFHFEDGKLVALGTSTDGSSRDPFLGHDEYEMRSDGAALLFYPVADPMARTDGSGDLAGSRFENSELIWEFSEDRLSSSMYDDEFHDWHDTLFEYRVEGEILSLSRSGNIGGDLIPQYLIELEDDCLKRASAYRVESCTPVE